MFENLLTVFYMMILLGFMILNNTVLGVVIAKKRKEFKFKKLVNGILKGILITFSTLLMSLSLELLPLVLGRVGIKIPGDLISTLEIIVTTLTAIRKYALDWFDKFKKILNIKEEDGVK